MSAHDKMYNRIYAATFAAIAATRGSKGLLSIAAEAGDVTNAAILYWSNHAGNDQHLKREREAREAKIKTLEKENKALGEINQRLKKIEDYLMPLQQQTPEAPK